MNHKKHPFRFDLFEILKRNNLTGTDIAIELGVTPQAVNRVMNSHIKSKRIEEHIKSKSGKSK